MLGSGVLNAAPALEVHLAQVKSLYSDLKEPAFFFVDENYDTVKKTLIFVETSPEMEIVDDLEDDLDDEDLSNDPADMPPELDDWPWRVQPSGPWLA